MNGNAHTNGYLSSSGLKRRAVNGIANQAAPLNNAPSRQEQPSFSERWEVPRKVLHSSIGFFTCGIYILRPPRLDIIIIPLCVVLIIVSGADFIRLRNGNVAFRRRYERLLGSLMRDVEKTSVNGVVWYLIGVIFVLVAYPRDIAVNAILLLSWADTAASIFGRLWGHLTPKLPPSFLYLPVASRKSLAGAFGSFLTATLTSWVFWGFGMYGMRGGLGDPVWTWEQPWTGGWLGLCLLSIGAGFITSLAEVLDLAGWDDNMTLPIITGAGVLLWTSLLSRTSII